MFFLKNALFLEIIIPEKLFEMKFMNQPSNVGET